MKILGINTATTVLSIALLDGKNILQERVLQGPTVKAEQITPWIEGMLKKARIKPEELNGIGVAQGPGAFTGLRIGVTTAKTLAQMLNIPLAGISTLEALAYSFVGQQKDAVIRIILNACRGEVNTALFSINNGSLRRLEEDSAENEALLLEKTEKETSFLAGDIPERYALRKLNGAPSAVSVARLAAQKIKNGLADDAKTLVPIYSHGPNIKLSPRIHGKLLNTHGN